MAPSLLPCGIAAINNFWADVYISLPGLLPNEPCLFPYSWVMLDMRLWGHASGEHPTLGNICAWKPEQQEPGRCYSWGVWRMKWRLWNTGLFFLGYWVATVWELHTGSCQPWTIPAISSKCSFTMSSPFCPPGSAFFSFLWTDLSFSLSSLLQILFSFLFLPSLSYSSIQFWCVVHGREEEWAAWPQRAASSLLPSCLLISFLFFLSLSFSSSFILVVLEIDAQATVMLDRDLWITTFLFLRWSLDK